MNHNLNFFFLIQEIIHYKPYIITIIALMFYDITTSLLQLHQK